MTKFKPNFYWYIRKHPGYIIGLVAPVWGWVYSFKNPDLWVMGFTSSALIGLMIFAIGNGYNGWKSRVLTQYDKDGNDITTTHK